MKPKKQRYEEAISRNFKYCGKYFKEYIKTNPAHINSPEWIVDGVRFITMKIGIRADDTTFDGPIKRVIRTVAQDIINQRKTKVQAAKKAKKEKKL